MNIWTLIMGLIALMILVLGVFAVIQYRRQAEIRKKHPGYPKGYWMNQGIGAGIAIGAGIGVAMGNIAIGVAIGVAIGAAIGTSLENRHKDQIRPITAEEEKIRRQSILFGIGSLIVMIIVVAVIYLIAN